jgi:tetratricopeptide (TPR) repeat protein
LEDSANSDALLAHARQCDACGGALHAMTVDFWEETTEAESQALGALASAQPEWQRQMAFNMAEASGRRRVIVPLRTWLARAAAIILAMGVGWLGWDLGLAPNPARLIATAYTERRPFDLRIPGAGHAAVTVQRGPAGSSLQRPAALLEAEAKIARELERNPQSVKWLDLRARAAMLDADADTAVATLERARQRAPDDAVLLADSGMAYALRENYKAGLEYLGRAIEARPDFAEAVFNRALVYERMSLHEDSAREWRRYLELDKAGPWHEEARQRLQENERQ